MTDRSEELTALLAREIVYVRYEDPYIDAEYREATLLQAWRNRRQEGVYKGRRVVNVRVRRELLG